MDTNHDNLIHDISEMSKNTLVENLGIEVLEISKNSIYARMPVDHRTVQPFGILHGGASAALAETVASIAGYQHIDTNHQICAGIEINANHISSVNKGYVFAKGIPLHVGKRTQVWDIKIRDDSGKLICVSRVTLANIEKSQKI